MKKSMTRILVAILAIFAILAMMMAPTLAAPADSNSSGQSITAAADNGSNGQSITSAAGVTANTISSLPKPWNVIVWVIIGVVSAGVIVLIIVFRRSKYVKSFLLDLVVKAEQALGSKTGQLKLNQVYAAFGSKFPIITFFISEERFASWVKEALTKMQKILEEKGATLLGISEEAALATADTAAPAQQ